MHRSTIEGVFSLLLSINDHQCPVSYKMNPKTSRNEQSVLTIILLIIKTVIIFRVVGTVGTVIQQVVVMRQLIAIKDGSSSSTTTKENIWLGLKVMVVRTITALLWKCPATKGWNFPKYVINTFRWNN